MIEAPTELSSFFDVPEFDPTTYDVYADLVYTSPRDRERFEGLLREYRQRIERGDGEPLRLGIGLLILGRFAEALEWLGRAPDDAFRRYYAGRANMGLQRFDVARGEFQRAAAKGWDGFETDMLCAAVHVAADEPADAEKLVEKHAAAGQDRGEWYYLRGLLEERRGARAAATEQYEKALTLSPDHAQAMFRCAWLYDMRGDDQQAIELYQRLALQPRAHVNALINLAVTYEDLGRYYEAAVCLRRVLKSYPNHTRARLFLKDVESAQQMVIDDTVERRAETRDRLLETPISEFELSVRARNCLKKMQIQTLGDLLRLTEAELLSYKNFGETSLNEIKALLTKRGLRLGQPTEEIDTATLEEATAKPPAPPSSEAVLVKPVSELELSVRARRCLQRLNIVTVGDLIQCSESDLLATRNFGVTSLNEIRSRLAEIGLQLTVKR
jgi:DNA-directed RNA polymerase subunit alpha